MAHTTDQAWPRVVHRGYHAPMLSLSQPQSQKSGISCWIDVARIQQTLACGSARWSWTSAAWVGGLFSSDLLPVLKRRRLASLTLTPAAPHLAPHKYDNCSLQMSGSCARATRVSVRSVCWPTPLRRFSCYIQVESHPTPLGCGRVVVPIL